MNSSIGSTIDTLPDTDTNSSIGSTIDTLPDTDTNVRYSMCNMWFEVQGFKYHLKQQYSVLAAEHA